MPADKTAFRKCTCWCSTSTPREIFKGVLHIMLCFSTRERIRKCSCWFCTSTPREILQVTCDTSLCAAPPKVYLLVFSSTPRGILQVTCDKCLCLSTRQRRQTAIHATAPRCYRRFTGPSYVSFATASLRNDPALRARAVLEADGGRIRFQNVWKR